MVLLIARLVLLVGVVLIGGFVVLAIVLGVTSLFLVAVFLATAGVALVAGALAPFALVVDYLSGVISFVPEREGDRRRFEPDE